MHDLLIIGAGPGGADMALEAANSGLSVVLIEKRSVGGVCLHEGCIPTKSYYAIAERLKLQKTNDRFGVISQFLGFDFQKAKQYKEEVVEKLHQGLQFSLKKTNITYVQGEAKFVDDHTVAVDNMNYQAKSIVIATGSHPVMIPGFDYVMTSTDLLATNEVPKNMVVIGGGIIGVELATIFAYFGSQVVIVEMMDTILPFADKEVAKRLMSYLKAQGITIYTQGRAIKQSAHSVMIHVKGKDLEVTCDCVLMAVGRKPNVDNLGLEQIGIAYDRYGIKVNENFQTNIPHIYAIGDVIGGKMLAHYATYNGFAVLSHILGQKHKIRFDLTPNCVFTFPEISWVGFTEDELKGKNITYEVVKGLYRSNGKANAMDEVDGFVKILMIDDEIVGVHIIGKDASVLIHEMATLMQKGISRKEFNTYIHAHPTLSEIFATTLR